MTSRLDGFWIVNTWDEAGNFPGNARGTISPARCLGRACLVQANPRSYHTGSLWIPRKRILREAERGRRRSLPLSFPRMAYMQRRADRTNEKLGLVRGHHIGGRLRNQKKEEHQSSSRSMVVVANDSLATSCVEYSVTQPMLFVRRAANLSPKLLDTNAGSEPEKCRGKRTTLSARCTLILPS